MTAGFADDPFLDEPAWTTPARDRITETNNERRRIRDLANQLNAVYAAGTPSGRVVLLPFADLLAEETP